MQELRNMFKVNQFSQEILRITTRPISASNVDKTLARKLHIRKKEKEFMECRQLFKHVNANMKSIQDETGMWYNSTHAVFIDKDVSNVCLDYLSSSLSERGFKVMGPITPGTTLRYYMKSNEIISKVEPTDYTPCDI